MRFTTSELRLLVGESATLSERLRRSVLPRTGAGDADLARKRLRRWCQRVAGGDEARFAKCLQWHGLDHASALAMLGAVTPPARDELPPWVDLLREAGEQRAGGRSASHLENRSSATGPADDPQPFEELLWPFVDVAKRRLFEAVGGLGEYLSARATLDLERALLSTLCGIASHTLFVEFSAFRCTRIGSLPTVGDDSGAGRRIYRAFVQENSRLPPWLMRYPMLARLLATRCQYWIERTGELLRRLADGEQAIRSTFGLDAGRLRVVRVASQMSDSHQFGRTVHVVELETGKRLVYKPRPLSIEVRFSRMLDELSKRVPELKAGRPAVVDCGDHGWVEMVEAAPCGDIAAVRRFYRRAGMLTCIVHALGGSDCHQDNLVAVGEHPVLVDLECIIGPPLTSAGSGQTDWRGDAGSRRAAARSVLRTGMVPVLQRGRDGSFRVAGGVVHVDRGLPVRGGYTAVNTDWMAWRPKAVSGPRTVANCPTLNGRTQQVWPHVPEFIRGFRDMYAVFAFERDAPAFRECIRAIENEQFRVLTRHSQLYATLLRGATAPQHLASGADWGIELDVCSAGTLGCSSKPASWATRRAELEELERLDIPIFFGHLKNPVLTRGTGAQLEERLEAADRYSPSAILASLDRDDLDQQVAELNIEFASTRSKLRSRSDRVARCAGSRGPLRRDQALVEAAAIVDLLGSLGNAHGDGPGWKGLVDSPETTESVLADVDFGLYGGVAGIALFLAAAARVLESEQASSARELLYRAVAPLVEIGKEPSRRTALASGIGIGSGAGIAGIVYALTRIGQLLEEPAWLKTACGFAGTITESLVAGDENHDVVYGTSGALLGLEALYRATSDGRWLDGAVDCGRRLLDASQPDPATGLRGWPAEDGHGPIGFAHGSSGIAYTLTRLSAATGDMAYRHAADEAWALERHCRSRGVREATREPTKQEPGNLSLGWCRGSAGFGLSRLEIVDEQDAWEDVTAAVKTACANSATANDSLCCGVLGQADFLLSAGRRLERTDLVEAARTLCGDSVRRSVSTGTYGLQPVDVWQPGLFRGLAGVGYELLRIHDPEVVPSVLVME